MWRYLSTLVAAMVALMFDGEKDPQHLAIVKPAMECAELFDIDIVDIGGLGSKINDVFLDTSNGVEVCVVNATLAPANIFILLLPTETWEQRYMQTGCGGLCGEVTLYARASMGCQTLNNGGFAMAATNMGHGGGMGNDGTWGVSAQLRADFAYRAQHIVSLASKKLIRMFYGQDPAYSYFNGCSDGGREALMEAERFPDDFDGIIAGAPAMLFQIQNTFYHGWQALSNTDADGYGILLSDKLPALHRAVLNACDANDGVEDGLISQPSRCSFDPSVLQCDEGIDNTECLTEEEIDVVNKFYKGPTDNNTGAYLTAGQPVHGSELEWQNVYVEDDATTTLKSFDYANPVLRYLAFPTVDPNRSVETLEFTEKTLNDLRTLAPLYDATMADLSAFEKKGGKLILWHGLSDPEISPVNTLTFHKRMLQVMGSERVEGFERLYLLPGVAHCGSGVGPSGLDLVTAMMTWVESKQAPVGIETASTEWTYSAFGNIDSEGPQAQDTHPTYNVSVTLPNMTRPVFPWPFTAVYDGTGDVYNASSWSQGPPNEILKTRIWPGSNLFGKYEFIYE